MKNLLLTITVLVGLAVSAVESSAQSVVIGGYPVFSGSFQHQGPIPDNLSNAVLNGSTTVTGSFSVPNGISSPSNSAALSRIANPLVANVLYTNPAAQGFIRVNLICTNTESAFLTNLTTGDVVFLGAVTAGQAGLTNYVNAIMRVGPSEVVALSNNVSLPFLQSSEWRN